jgi:hypothetical protein
MPYGTVNADVIQTSTSGGILGAGNASIMKNRIINGAMVIDQRNGGASTTPSSDSTYNLDRWQARMSTGSKFSVQQNAGSVTPPVGFNNYLGITSTSSYSASSTDFFDLEQIIEGFNVQDLAWGTANAKTVTLSFQVYSSKTGTFGGSLFNNAANRSYPFTYTIASANTWTSASVTIAGDTSGSWTQTNGAGIYLNFDLGSGTGKVGTAGAWAGATYWGASGCQSIVATNGATFYITGVQLEVGSSATGFEYRLYNQELLACYRYFQKWLGNSANEPFSYNCTAGGSTTSTEGPIILKTTMRSTPSVSISNVAVIDANAVFAATGATIYSNSTDSPRLGLTGLSGLTSYRYYYGCANNTTSAYVWMSAEL